jgi:hypothetical protein
LPLPSTSSAFFEGPFAEAVTIRRNDGSLSKDLRGIWELGTLTEQTTTLQGGEASEHRAENPHCTLLASEVTDYGEGDQIVHETKAHTILDRLTDDSQTTFILALLRLMSGTNLKELAIAETVESGATFPWVNAAADECYRSDKDALNAFLGLSSFSGVSTEVYGLSLLNQADASAARSTLGLGSLSTLSSLETGPLTFAPANYTESASTMAGHLSGIDDALAGGGDFMADGSVPMTGDVNLGGNTLINTGSINGASPTEMGYLAGVTSGIQAQIDAAGGGAFGADANTQITPSTPIVLDQATGDEAALTLDYTTNKATSGNDTGLLINQTDTLSPGTSKLLDLQVGGVSKLSVDSGGEVFGSGVNSSLRLTDSDGAELEYSNWRIGIGGSTAYFYQTTIAKVGMGVDGLRLADSGALRWSSGSQASTGHDLILSRDAANTLAQRNGVNAQTFNIYNTDDGAGNYERGFLKWDAEKLKIGVEKGGTGSPRSMEFHVEANRVLSLASSFCQIDRDVYIMADIVHLGTDVGFYGATPAPQAAHIADATSGSDVITRVNAILVALENIGITAAA